MINSDKALIQELYYKMKSQMLKPRTIVDYNRESYIYKSGNVRITFDSNVRSGICSLSLLIKIHLPLKIPNNDVIILRS